MENILMSTSKTKLTEVEKIALMLLGGDCDSDCQPDWEDYLDDIQWQDGLDETEIDIIEQLFDWMDENGQDGYINFDEDGGVQFHYGESPGGDNRVSKEEWDQWKDDNGYQ